MFIRVDSRLNTGVTLCATAKSQSSLLLARIAPNKWQLPDLRNICDHIIRFFFRSYWLLRLELAVEKADGMHSQLLTSSYLASRAVTDNQNFAGREFRSVLDFAEGCFFGQRIVAVSEIDFFDGWLAIQPQRFHFCVLDLGFTKTDNEISDAAFS